MKTVLLFRTPFMRQNWFDYEPLFEHARRNAWRIQTIDYLNGAVTRYWQDNPVPRPDVRGMIELWNPDGCIVECGGIPEEPWLDEFKGLPTIFLDRPGHGSGRRSATISSNSRDIAAAAAKELLSLGIDEFAYAANSENLPWNIDRGHYFAELIKQHGKRIRSFTVPKSQSTGGPLGELSTTLISLPRPCGIFAANDKTAATVINECDRLGIDIPGEFAVISVDNDPETCEHLPVTLTSIEQDFAMIGAIAAHALDDLMAGKTVPETITFGVKRVVRRLSTFGTAGIDRRVALAVDHIRSHFAENLTLCDIAKHMHCCERQASRLFEKWRGHAPIDELHLQRISNAKELLGNPETQISTIAGICGYSSYTDFGRVFKRYTGLTPRAWQKQQGRR